MCENRAQFRLLRQTFLSVSSHSSNSTTVMVTWRRDHRVIHGFVDWICSTAQSQSGQDDQYYQTFDLRHIA